MKKEIEKEENEIERDYFFPNENITIKAKNIIDANEKLKEILFNKI